MGNNFVDKGNKEILNANTSQNFALVFKFLPSTGSTSHLLSFASVSSS